MVSESRRRRVKTAAAWVLAGVCCVLVAIAAVLGVERTTGTTQSSAIGGGSVTVSSAGYVPPTMAQVEKLPEARYNTVIDGLMPYQNASVPSASLTVYTINADTPIFGADQKVAVARFGFRDFLGNPTVVVPVKFHGPWVLVMTPARQTLPSRSAGNAPAQTVGWIRATAMTRMTTLTNRVVISLSTQTLSILATNGSVQRAFKVGVGTTATPTPSGVTGYLQARYLDPSQGESVYPIDLTSLHSSAADEPFGGKDGGLIGVHYFNVHDGAVSHGCVRLSEDAITAINKLPLGTSVTIVT